MTYDTKCFELADAFIGDCEPEQLAQLNQLFDNKPAAALASEIQYQIEAWLQMYAERE